MPAFRVVTRAAPRAGTLLRRAQLSPVRFAACAYGALAVVLAAVVAVAGRTAHIAVAFTGQRWLDSWLQWDGGWYYGIARRGYFFHPGEESSVAFFPGYPLALRAVAALTGSLVLAGVLTTLACGLATAVLFARWCAGRLRPDAARVAIVLLLLYPFTYYLVGAVYGDALFLVAVIGAFLLLERGLPWLAGLAGAVATATRPTGIAVVVGLVAVAVCRRSVEPPGRPLVASALTALRRDGGVLLSLGGLVAYSSYLAARFGDPLAFITAQDAPAWAQPPGPHTWFKISYVDKVLAGKPFASVLTANAVVALLAVALLPRVFRRFGWGYGVFAAVSVLLPLTSTGDFLGMGRYVLGAFPVFAALADLLLEPRWRRLLVPLLAASTVVLLGFTVAYSRGLPTS